MNELVVILKKNEQKNAVGAVLADRDRPPFAERRDGYRLRWWGADHSVSKQIRELVGVNGLCPFTPVCYESLGLEKRHCGWNLDNPRTWQFCGGYKRRNKKL